MNGTRHFGSTPVGRVPANGYTQPSSTLNAPLAIGASSFSRGVVPFSIDSSPSLTHLLPISPSLCTLSDLTVSSPELEGLRERRGVPCALAARPAPAESIYFTGRGWSE